jgi:hypothetical protein
MPKVGIEMPTCGIEMPKGGIGNARRLLVCSSKGIQATKSVYRIFLPGTNDSDLKSYIIQLRSFKEESRQDLLDG